jgi:hypothetical protein
LDAANKEIAWLSSEARLMAFQLGGAHPWFRIAAMSLFHADANSIVGKFLEGGGREA